MGNEAKTKMTSSQVMLVFIAGIASYLDAAILVSCGVALPLWTQYFNFSPLISGSINTALTVAVAVGAMSGGALSDKFGRVLVFNLDILFVAIGTALVAFATNMAMLFIGLILAGVASGADLPTSLAVISERMDKENYGKAISSTQLFWTLGILLSQGIGYITSSMKYIAPVKYLFGFIAVIAFLNWCVRIFSKRFRELESGLADKVQTAEGTEEVAETKPKLMELLSNKRILLPLIVLTLFYLFWNLPANSFGMFLNYFLVIADKQTAATATIVALVGNILGFLANLVFIRVADTKYRYHFMFGGLVLAWIAFLIAGLSANYWLIFSICYCASSVGNSFIGEPIYKIWTQSFYPVNARASLTGFSLGIVRALTAVFALITPTLMAISPAVFLWTLFVCACFYGAFSIVVVRLIAKYNIHDNAISRLKESRAAKN